MFLNCVGHLKCLRELLGGQAEKKNAGHTGLRPLVIETASPPPPSPNPAWQEYPFPRNHLNAAFLATWKNIENVKSLDFIQKCSAS